MCDLNPNQISMTLAIEGYSWYLTIPKEQVKFCLSGYIVNITDEEYNKLGLVPGLILRISYTANGSGGVIRVCMGVSQTFSFSQTIHDVNVPLYCQHG